MKNLKKINIWSEGVELVKKTYQLAGQPPFEERHGMRAQLTRSAVLMPSNIADGGAKSSSRDYIKFQEIAPGSVYELETQVVIAEMIGMAKEKFAMERLLKDIDEEQKMLQRFIQSVETP